MAPRSNATESSAKSAAVPAQNNLEITKNLKLNDLRKALPEEVFNKSLPTSLFYLVFDVSAILTALYMMHTLANSSAWGDLSIVIKAAAWLAYWNVSGFFMWCLFVVGHDCGHGTFSEYEWVNDIVGHITHGAILVPFYPWQMTHRRHHMYHNHVTKDYSHPWYTAEREGQGDEGLYRFFRENNDLMATFPLFGWTAYLLGSPDGSHFIPFPSQRMWKESPSEEFPKCIASTAVVCAYAYLVFSKVCGGDLSAMSYYYLIPILVFGWWLVCVTYLQHHCPTTIVYDNDTWNFFTAAFETVDRTFGYGIDDLSHNITDGHVVHHLFYTKIPHYHLKKATKAMQGYLQDNNAMHLYKHDITFDFMFRVHKYFRDFGYGATLFTEEGGAAKKSK